MFSNHVFNKACLCNTLLLLLSPFLIRDQLNKKALLENMLLWFPENVILNHAYPLSILDSVFTLFTISLSLQFITQKNQLFTPALKIECFPQDSKFRPLTHYFHLSLSIRFSNPLISSSSTCFPFWTKEGFTGMGYLTVWSNARDTAGFDRFTISALKQKNAHWKQKVNRESPILNPNIV